MDIEPRRGFSDMNTAMEWGERKAKEWECVTLPDGRRRGISMGWAAITVDPPGTGWFVRCGFASGPSLEVWPEDCGI